MEITKTQLEELIKKGKVEIWNDNNVGAEVWDILEVING